MSAFVTLGGARDAFEHLIITQDFIQLVNRAAERLYRKGAAPGWNKEVAMATPDANGEMSTVFNDTSHVLAFKVNDTPYNVTGIETSYKLDRSGGDRFLDLGYTSATERSYRLPKELLLDDGDYSGYTVTALIRPAYVPVAIDADTLPLQNVDSLKLAAMSIQYEDESDLERAAGYMEYALSEREADSSEFRGPQVNTIGVHDPASDHATEHFN